MIRAFSTGVPAYKIDLPLCLEPEISCTVSSINTLREEEEGCHFNWHQRNLKQLRLKELVCALN